MRKLFIICALLFSTLPASATISWGKGANSQAADGVDTVTATFSGNNTAGCMLIVTAANYGYANPNLFTPTDTAGDTGHFVLIHSYFGQSPLFTFVATWYVTNCVGGANAVTV